MLYILGGASRSGKTLLARRAVAEKRIPYFPLDALVGGVIHGLPELGVAYNQPFIQRSENMWRINKPFLTFFPKEEGHFLIEGDLILPKQVNELILEGAEVKSCFIGYPERTAQEKLAFIRMYHQGETDWTRDISDQEMLPMIDEMIEYSNYLKEECGNYGIPYFDISHNFEKPREEAFKCLFAE